MDNIEEIMPLIYAPIVGQACRLYGHLLRRPRELYTSIRDRGHGVEVRANCLHQDARVIVVTDGGAFQD